MIKSAEMFISLIDPKIVLARGSAMDYVLVQLKYDINVSADLYTEIHNFHYNLTGQWN